MKILLAHSHFLNEEVMYYLTKQTMPEKHNYFLILNHLYFHIKREHGFILEIHYKTILLVHITRVLHRKPMDNEVILVLKSLGKVEFYLTEKKKRITVKFYKFSQQQTTVRLSQTVTVQKAFLSTQPGSCWREDRPLHCWNLRTSSLPGTPQAT